MCMDPHYFFQIFKLDISKNELIGYFTTPALLYFLTNVKTNTGFDKYQLRSLMPHMYKYTPFRYMGTTPTSSACNNAIHRIHGDPQYQFLRFWEMSAW